MGKRVIIIGAVALGPKVACRLRRLDPEAEITVIDRDNLISYGGCGIPYYVGGDIADIEGLCSTAAHTIRDAEFFKMCKGVTVLTRVEATDIDRQARKLTVMHLDEGREEQLEYDKLVMATGSEPIKPRFPGVDLPGVHSVSNLHHAELIKNMVTRGKVSRAVVIGGGAIGIELAEALSDLWDVKTTIVELADHLLPSVLGRNIGQVVEKQLEEHDVDVLTSHMVEKITRDEESGVLQVHTSGTTLECELVVVSIGVKPNSELARKAGIAVGQSGGIRVDDRMRTSDPHIYSGGDCVEIRNLVSGESMLMPLGSLANKQGRVIASNINGGNSHFKGAVGAFCMKVYDIGVSKAGLTSKQARAAGFDPVYSVVSQADHAHFYPSSSIIHMKLIADRRSRKILGVEASGKMGEAVKARVDTIAVLLGYGIDVDEVCRLETGYAPPFASAMDVINNAGNALDNILNGANNPVDEVDFRELFYQGKTKVVDIRGAKEAAPFIAKYGENWINIPQNELRERFDELPKDEQLYLLCDTGPRSYEAQVFLASKGVTNTRNIQGGYAMIKVADPQFSEAVA